MTTEAISSSETSETYDASSFYVPNSALSEELKLEVSGYDANGHLLGSRTWKILVPAA